MLTEFIIRLFFGSSFARESKCYSHRSGRRIVRLCAGERDIAAAAKTVNRKLWFGIRRLENVLIGRHIFGLVSLCIIHFFGTWNRNGNFMAIKIEQKKNVFFCSCWGNIERLPFSHSQTHATIIMTPRWIESENEEPCAGMCYVSWCESAIALLTTQIYFPILYIFFFLWVSFLVVSLPISFLANAVPVDAVLTILYSALYMYVYI